VRNFSFNNKNIICIVGLGYVGLPLLIEFSKFYKMIGFDINEAKLKRIKKKYNLIFKDNIITTDEKKINLSDIIIVCLPTPINKFKKPDISILKNASKVIGKNIKKNTIIIYESTVYPGTTERICLPIIEKNSGLKEGVDFHIAYSPERINPGDNKNTLVNVAKVVSARNYYIARLIAKLYQKIIKPKIFIAPSILVAETAKMIENIQRDINIAFVNELSVLFNKLDIPTNEVLKAASTKWNFHYYKPGLVGGHCISVDPYYLAFKAKTINLNSELITSGRRINERMGYYVANQTLKLLKKNHSNFFDKDIAILGFSFKENIPDIRNTKVIKIIRALQKKNSNIKVFDPIVSKQKVKKIYNLKIYDFDELNKFKFDAIILAVSHTVFLKKLSFYNQFYKNKNKKILIDLKNNYSIYNLKKEKFKFFQL